MSVAGKFSCQTVVHLTADATAFFATPTKPIHSEIVHGYYRVHLQSKAMLCGVAIRRKRRA
jgi:hypothetical protein